MWRSAANVHGIFSSSDRWHETAHPLAIHGTQVKLEYGVLIATLPHPEMLQQRSFSGIAGKGYTAQKIAHL